MLKDLVSALLRLAKKALIGTAVWLVSLFFILIVGTILEQPSRGESLSMAYSLVVVFVPIGIGLISFFISGKARASQSKDIAVTSQSELHSFLDAHCVVDEIRTKVVGVTFDNDDGSSRQDILSRCSVGDQVYFRYFTYRGNPAYSVSATDGQIGNLPAELASSIDQFYDGCTLYGTITKISGAEDGFYYGCNLLIYVFREKGKDLTIEATNEHTPVTVQESSSTIHAQNIIYPNSRKRNKHTEPSVDSNFIAETQWYAARGGTDLIDDE